MKRFFSLAAIITMLCLSFLAFSLTAFAYNAVDGSSWVDSITVDENGSVTVALNEADFVTPYAPNGYRVAIFTSKPTLNTEPENGQPDPGFWVIYNGTGAVYHMITGSGPSFTITKEQFAFESGQTYYIALTGNNGALNPDWTWTTTVYSFRYTDAKLTAAGGTKMDVVLLDGFDYSSEGINLGFWDDGKEDSPFRASTTITDGKLNLTTGPNGVSAAWVQYGGSFPAFINADGKKISANTTALILKASTDNTMNFAFEADRWNGGTTVATYLTASGDDILLMDEETGLLTVATVTRSAWGRHVIALPANFNGHIIIPTSRFSTSSEADAVGDWNSGSAEGFCYFWTLKPFVEADYTKPATLSIDAIYTLNSELPAFVTRDYSYTVSFDTEGVAAAATNTEGKITLPAAPEKDGFDFKGWFTEANGKGTEITADTVFDANTQVYAYYVAKEVPQPTADLSFAAYAITALGSIGAIAAFKKKHH